MLLTGYIPRIGGKTSAFIPIFWNSLYGVDHDGSIPAMTVVYPEV
jgi:hypothetical protein